MKKKIVCLVMVVVLILSCCVGCTEVENLNEAIEIVMRGGKDE